MTTLGINCRDPWLPEGARSSAAGYSHPNLFDTIFTIELSLAPAHDRPPVTQAKNYSLVLKRLRITHARPASLKFFLLDGLMSDSPGRRTSHERSIALSPNPFLQLRWMPPWHPCSATPGKPRPFRYAALTTVGALICDLSRPSFASPLPTPAPTWAPWVLGAGLMVALAGVLLLWWKRAWLTSWWRWLGDLFRDLGAAMGSRHHVIHDRRYLEQIIKAELESESQALRTGRGYRRFPDHGDPRPSSRSLLRSDSRRRR